MPDSIEYVAWSIRSPDAIRGGSGTSPKPSPDHPPRGPGFHCIASGLRPLVQRWREAHSCQPKNTPMLNS